MDSPLPGRVYDARTLAAGGTNADDVSDALRDLEVVTYKENTSPMWHREEQVRGENPDLIISHLSSLYDVRMAKADEETAANLFDAAETRLTLFFGYLSVTNPRARFLVYSRGQFATKESEEVWLGDVIARFPRLKGRLFRDARTRRKRERDVPRSSHGGAIAHARPGDPRAALMHRVDRSVAPVVSPR